ncbi:MAG TPA: bifunctional helix-turn-helix transcriptional regulator/GNAT family N-acetyltransferase [Stellaceae bacterium]|nr:bifunctional helix-turn-helix transcriptional regulator/GNAT family N-acetyltransferase [Stellaceae bacterium]
MAESELQARVDAIRAFNRFYTQKIGVLQEGLLASPFSLTEARVLYELAQRENATASGLCRDLGLDAGYLSRILRRFDKEGLVAREPSATDGRQSHLSLTEAGRAAFGGLNRRSREEVAALLQPLGPSGQARLVAAMGAIERLLGAERDAAPWALRQHRPGDMGWVVSRHGAVYAEEFGWDDSFEALVAEITARFIRRYEPAAERCWIAERDGERLGSVFLVKQSPRIAKLRLLLVEREARGLGIGAALVDECIAFARAAGYRKITLWTQSMLLPARRIYETAGFRRVREEPHHSFGRDLVGEYWEMRL